MRNNDLIYAGHMLDMARLAVSKIQNKTRIDFDADENLRLALTHLIQIIGIERLPIIIFSSEA